MAAVIKMRNPNINPCFPCDPLTLTTAVNTLAVAIAGQLDDKELGMLAAIFTQLGDTLGTIAAQREFCAPPEK